MSRVLVVEDDLAVREVIKQALSIEGVQAVGVGSGEEALQRLHNSSSFELMILDLTLPGIDDFTVCRELRAGAAGKANRDLPVLMLSVRDDEASVVGGLEVGADDYVTKPFRPRELASRVRAHLRRRRWQESVEKEEPQRISFPGLEIDLLGRRVVSQGVPVGLSRKEFDVLALLAASPGWAYSNEQIMSYLWDGHLEGHFFGESRAASAHISNLRKKIESDPTTPLYIRNERGVGYKFTYPPEN